MNNNKIIIKELYSAANNHPSPHGKKALLNVITIIKHLDFDIKDTNDIKNIKGIGKGSLRRIKIILDGGTLNHTQISSHLNELKMIYGIGDMFAKKLYNDGIKTIEDLKKSNISLNDSQKIGLKYYKDFQLKIPRSEIKIYRKYFINIVKSLTDNTFMKIVGSFRRRCSESGDIDILLTGDNCLYHFVDKLKKDKFLTADLCWGDKKYMGVYENKNGIGRRIDIRFIEYEYFFPALLHYTGSGEHNVIMRKKAIEMGYKLNEYGIWKNNKPIEVNSEKEIFDILNMDYVKPHHR